MVLIDVFAWSALIEILNENKLKDKLAKDFTDRINKCQHGTFNFLYDSTSLGKCTHVFDRALRSQNDFK